MSPVRGPDVTREKVRPQTYPDGQVACRSFSGASVGLPGGVKPWRLRYALCEINDVFSYPRASGRELRLENKQ